MEKTMNQGYHDINYKRTYIPEVRNPYTLRTSDDEIKINVLTEENEKLRKQYSDLLKKAAQLIDLCRNLEKENEILKKKKTKHDLIVNGFVNIKKEIQKGINKSILWINT